MNKSQKWLVITSHDERYDFNLLIQIFTGTLKEVEDEFLLHPDNRKIEENSIYVYEDVTRNDSYCSCLDDNTWGKLKNHLDVVKFSFGVVIPFNLLERIPNNQDNNLEFIFNHPLVHRNVKFGFLDIKNRN